MSAGGDDDVKSEVEVMAVRPEEEESEDEEGGEVEVGTDAERLRVEKADGYFLKRVADPTKPAEQEVKYHYHTHVPCRNWCPCCVKAKGKDLDHRKAVDGERGLNEYSFDYCFPGDEFGHRLTVLVGRERMSGTTMATVTPSKGGSGKFMTARNVATRLETSSSRRTRKRRSRTSWRAL